MWFENGMTPSQKILLRVEFDHNSNRLQFWAYTLDAPKKQLMRASLNKDFGNLIQWRKARESISTSYSNDNKLFVACPAISGPNIIYSPVDFEKYQFQNFEELSTSNSIQLILDNLNGDENCYYFLQVVSCFFINTDKKSTIKYFKNFA